MNTLSDGRVISPLVTDDNWHAVRAYRARNCVRVMARAEESGSPSQGGAIVLGQRYGVEAAS